MADEQPKSESHSQSSSDNEEVDPSRIDRSLENFVTEHYQQQKVGFLCRCAQSLLFVAYVL